MSLWTLQSPYIIPGLLPTGFRDLLVSSEWRGINLPSGVYTHYHLPISLVLFTHSVIDAFEFALVGLNYTVN